MFFYYDSSSLKDELHTAAEYCILIHRHKRYAKAGIVIIILSPVCFFLIMAVNEDIIIAYSSLVVVSGLGWSLLFKFRSLFQRYSQKLAGLSMPYAEEILNFDSPNKYSIFLRTFETELGYGYDDETFISLNEHKATGNNRLIESLILKKLNGIPLIALNNPKDPLPIPGAYRFKEIPEDWISFVKRLLIKAEYIFIHFTTSSSGINIELDMISELELKDKVYIIVDEKYAKYGSKKGRKALSELSVFGKVIFQNQSKPEEVYFSKLYERINLKSTDAKFSIIKLDSAGFTVRNFAYLLDVNIVNIPMLLFIDYLEAHFEKEQLGLIAMFNPLLFEALLFRTSFGKRILKIQVVDNSYRKLGLKRHFLRSVCKIGMGLLFPITFPLNALIASMDKEKRALYDMMSGTRVVYRKRLKSITADSDDEKIR